LTIEIRGLILASKGSEKPLPQISFVNRHQILVWVSDPMSRSPIRGIVVLISVSARVAAILVLNYFHRRVTWIILEQKTGSPSTSKRM
jgi:hypothetical protein